jgi:hypothetical protein
MQSVLSPSGYIFATHVELLVVAILMERLQESHQLDFVTAQDSLNLRRFLGIRHKDL